MLKTRSRRNALTALLLLVSAACLGRIMALYAPSSIRQMASLLCQVWLLVLPLAWFFWVDRGKLKISLPKRRELLAGIVLGLLMFGIILGAYWLFVGQHWIDVRDIRVKAQQVGISSTTIYLVGALYWTLINSLFEEYIWRFLADLAIAIVSWQLLFG